MNTLDQETKENQELAEYLAKELGGKPERVGPCWFCVCLEADPRPSQKVWKGYCVSKNGPKWKISGSYPRDVRGQGHFPKISPEIGISMSRGKEALADGIRKRLAADYDAAHAEAVEQCEKWNEYYKVQDEAKAVLIDRYDGSKATQSDEQIYIKDVHEVRVQGDKVTIKTCNLDLLTAIKVLDAITGK